MENRSDLDCIPEANECFRNCKESIYQKDYSREYREFIKQSDRCKNKMTQAKTQPFCRQYNLNLGVYNVKQKIILPRSLTQRNIFLYIHDNHFYVICKINLSTYFDTIKDLKGNFKYESNQISDVIIKQVIEYKFPISNEKNCMFAVVALDLETCNVEKQLYCEAYAAGVYHLNRLCDCFKGDLTEKNYKPNEKMWMYSIVKTTTQY